MKRLLITPGDPSGIGLEITLKTLKKINKSKLKSSYIFFASEENYKKHLEALQLDLKVKTISRLDQIESEDFYLFSTNFSPLEIFDHAIEFCSQNPKDAALVTGPMSKKEFSKSSSKGHTDHLKKLFSNKTLFMTFFGDLYNCLLLTEHMPLHEVSKNISIDLIEKAIKELKGYNEFMNLQKPIGLLGLNPHAGEDSLIGAEESKVHQVISAKYPEILGPLPSDSLFSAEEYKKFSFLIANYHDQGLIAFKLLNGLRGAQATLGLPFVRSSVDHGTAHQLFLQNRAQESSMTKAINLAMDLLEMRGKNAV